MNSVIRSLRIVSLFAWVFFITPGNAYAQTDSAMTFDGVDDYVDAGGVTAFDLTGDMTVETWFYINSMASDWVRIVGKSGPNMGDPRTFGLWYYIDGSILFQNGYQVSSAPGLVVPGQWYHIAGVINGGMMTMYLNGQLIATGPSNAVSSSGPLTMGYANFHTYHNGLIDEVRIWNVARTQAEIYNAAHSTLLGNEPGLVALYHFDQVTGMTTPDATVNNLYGTLINGPFLSPTGSLPVFPVVPPAGLKAIGGLAQASLNWQPSFESDFHHYNIYMGTSPNPTELAYSTTLGRYDTSRIFTGLTNFTTYYFTVTAVDSDANESAFSNEVSATPSTFVEVLGTGFENASDGNFVWGDYDNDGDYDVFISGQDASNADPPYAGGFAKLYRHETNGSFTLIDAGFQQQIWRTAAAWGDYNNDGFLDLVYTGSSGNGTRTIKLYKNNGDGTFTDVPNTMQGIFLGALAWGDYDNDGDQDLFVMGSTDGLSTYLSIVYQNEGNGNFIPVDIGIPGYVSGSCSWGDYDNDGDLDLLIMGSTNNSPSGARVVIYRNDGGGAFTNLNDYYEGTLFENALRGKAIWADYDNDGKLDVAYAGATGDGGRIAKIYRNDGYDVFSDSYSSLTGVALATVSAGDFDNDGDMDFFFSGTPDGNSSKIAYMARNDEGEGRYFTEVNIGIAGVSNNDQFVAASALIDYDRDYDLDLMIEGETIDDNSNYTYITKLYKNESAVANQIPSDPTGLGTVTSSDTVWFSWIKSNDNGRFPDDGLTYNLRVGTTPAGVQVMAPMAKVVGSTNAGGFRLVQEMGNVGHNNSWRLSGLADGTYYWSVESIDQIYRNSKFQAEQNFVIDGPPTAPANLIGSAGVNAVTLKWDRSQRSSVSKYYIFGDVSPNPTMLIDSADGGTADTTKTITGLTNDQVYYFRVMAVDPSGHASDYSSEVSVRPSATPGRIFVNGEFDLASAITEANSLSQPDTITFEYEPGSMIYLWSALPAITGDYTVIDGDVNADGIPDITLNGNGEGRIYSPALILNSSHNVIKGLIIQGCGDMYSGGGGILISGPDAHDNRILTNYIGTDESGMFSDYNGYGIRIEDGAHNNWIGEGTALGRNVISGNQQYGVIIDGSGASCDSNRILGNFIGITSDGLSALPNSSGGIHLYHKANHNKIGNATVGGRNIISGNAGYGIYLEDTFDGHLESNTIYGNYIGTDASGLEAVPNQLGGIYLQGYTGGGEIGYSILHTQIGDGSIGGMNVISGNGDQAAGSGIEISSDRAHDNIINRNYIGVGADGVTPLGNIQYGMYLHNYAFRNTIMDNTIEYNGGAGVFVDNSGETTISGNTISANGSSGIQFYYSSNNKVFGNLIGTDAAGTSALANNGYGIHLEYSSSDNQIGDGTPAGRNVISGNSYGGVRIFDNYSPVSRNKLFGNYIGTDISGNTALPNAGNGVILEDYATENEIGGLEPGQGNVISGNNIGIYIGSSYPTGGGTDWNKVQGNIIGLGADGSTVLANSGHGIYADGLVRNIEIVKNVISGNSQNGIYIDNGDKNVSDYRVIGNYIGTDALGLLDKGNVGTGIYITGLSGSSATNISIGDGTEAGRNIISGNDEYGILFDGSSVNSNRIFKNYIGLNLNGEIVGNGQDGIRLVNNTYNDTVADNIISGNGWNGIVIDGSHDHVILGNRIGTDTSGSMSAGNGQSGIFFYDTYATYGIKIGDGTEKGRNVISGNTSHGIVMLEESQNGIYGNLILKNYIGSASNGITPLGNSGSGVVIRSVAGGQEASITNNQLNGNTIAFNVFDGVTMDGLNVHTNVLLANSIYDNGTGGIVHWNNAQSNIEAPVITVISPDSTVQGISFPNARIQIFADTTNQGKVFLDTTLADESGNWFKKVTMFAGMNVTALQDDAGSTSPFSEPFTPNFVPSAPTGLFAVAGDGKVKLTWKANTDGLTSKYFIYGDQTANPSTLIDSTTGGPLDTSETISGLTNDQIYYFRVTAVNASAQESGFSNEDAAVPVVEAGRAISMDGTSQYAVIPHASDLALSRGDDFSISAWLYPTAYADAEIFDKTANTGAIGEFQIWTHLGADSLIKFNLGWEAYFWEGLISNYRYRTNEWMHVTFVKTADTSKIYVNGVLDNQRVLTNYSAPANTVEINLGRFRRIDAFFFPGMMDEIALWRTALNADDIKQMMIKPIPGNLPMLAGLWHFDEASGTGISYDGSVLANNAIVNGANSVLSGAMAPLAPTGVSAMSQAPDSVSVQWSANTESDLAYYMVYRSLSGGFIPSPGDSVGRINNPGVSFSDITVVPGKTYYYRIAAVDSAQQEGLYSNQASVFYGDPLTVYNNNNSGDGSLRAAVDTANARAGADTIYFDSSVKDSTIILLSTITLQPGNGNGTVIDGDIDGDHKPSIILAGTGGNYHGIEIRGNNNTIKHVNMVRHGVFLQPSSAIYINTNSNFNRIIGNYFGTNLTATDTVNTGNNISITVSTSASNNFIGDTLPECRNVISGTSWSGMQLRGSGNYILNNIIGLNAAGTTSMGSPNMGIYVLSGSSNNFIGNGTPAGRNIISGNRYGISIQSISNANTHILGNYIGTDITGTAARGNSQGGIALAFTTYNHIGDGTAGGRNVISGNSVGIHVGYQCNNNVIDGNYIGVAGDGLTALGNGSYGIWIYGDAGNGYATHDSVVNNVIANSGTGVLINASGTFGHKVFRNSIYNNSGFGINITNGAQEGVLRPVIQLVAGDSTVSGYASPGALLQIYADAAEEGRYFLDTAYADGLGNWSKKVTIPSGIQLTALQDSNHNTSMFSLPKSLTSLAPTGLSAMAGDRKVQLRWNSNPELDVAKYRIYWGTNPNPTQLQDSTLGRLDTAIAVSGLSYGQVYYFRISAVNLIGNESVASSDASAIPYTKGMVMNTLDAGVGSLRWAIDSANAYPGADTIHFAAILKDSIIKINSSLTLQSGNGNGTVIDGDIDGDNKPSVTVTAGFAGYQGIYISGSGNTIKNLNITGFRAQNTAAILIEQGQYNRVVGCFLGTNLAGTDTAGTGNFLGVWVAMSGSNVIGDTVAEGRNVISGNTRGVAITFNSVGNWILGNYIGTDATGSTALGNTQFGIELSSDAKFNRIGHWNTDGRNIIAGSGWYGITVSGGSDSNEIVNNYIGTDAGGNYAIPNGTGVLVQTSYNAVGRPSAGNLISGNTNAGIHLMLEKQNAVAGNIIGLNAAGTTAIPNGVGIQLDNTDSVLIGGTTPEERNVISGNTNGIMMLNAPHTRIVGNYIGTDIGGASAIPGTQQGIWIQSSTNLAIGDGTEGGRNVISGNQFGLRITGCDSTSVIGNFFGLDKSGTFAVPNSTAIHLDYSTHTLVGDGTTGGRNIISGNTTGIYFYSSFINGMTNYNWIKGNFIGTDYSGTVAVPNGYGILINDRVRNNFIGDGTAGGRNIISGNSASAVSIWALQDQGENVFNDNYVGLDVFGNALGNAAGFELMNGASGDSLINNSIAYNIGPGVLFDGSTTDSNIVWTNAIFQNSGGGIRIVNGAQGGLAAPVITSVLYDSTVTGTAEPFALVHLYVDSLDQGSIFMDSVYAQSDGTWAKKMILLPNMKITAIQQVNHNSSEFSAPFAPILGALASLPAALDYDNVSVGGNASLTARLFVSSGGVIINDVTLAGGIDYSISGLTVPDTLYAGDTLTVDVQFTPTTFGLLTDTLLIANNSGMPVFQIALTGTGLSGDLASIPATFDFGDVAVGDSAQTLLKVYSAGGAVTVSDVFLASHTTFVIDSSSGPSTLYSGDTLYVYAKYRAGIFASSIDTIVVSSNALSGSFRIVLSGTGSSGVLSALPTSQNFGNVAVSDSIQMTIGLFSTGGAVSISGTDMFMGSSFRVDSLTGPSVLFAGDTMTIYTTYRPLNFGAAGDTMYILSNSQAGTLKVPLLGTGLSGVLSAIPGSHDFGNVQTGDSLTKTFMFYSNGGAVQITASSLFDATQYRIVSSVGPSTLYLGDTLAITVLFKPQTFGIKNDTLLVTNNSAVSPLKIAIAGTGSIGSLYASPTALAFGSVQIGDSASGTVKLFGTSSGITVSNAMMTQGGHFSISAGQTLPATLNIGDTLLAAITFKPMTFGTIADTAQIINISVNNPFNVAVSGIGAVGTLAPMSANFGLVTIGDSLTKTLKLYTNTGAVRIDSVRFDLGSEFTVVAPGSMPDTIFPGDTLSMLVKYRPLTFATTSDTIRIFNNSSQSVFSVTLNGIGNSGTLANLPTGLNFGNIMLGDSSVQRLKIYAIGANIIVNGGFLETGGDYTIVSTSGWPVTLVAGTDTMTVDVKYKPSAFGPSSDRLFINNNSLIDPLKINVMGTGSAGTLAAEPFGYDFGQVSVNDSLQQAIKIYAAAGKVIVSSLTLDAGIRFTLNSVAGLPDTLSTGDTLVARVTFAPDVTGILRDTLRIGNNSQVPSLNLGLTGNGGAGTLASDVSAVSFGNVQVGDHAQTTVRLYSTSGQVIVHNVSLGISGRYAFNLSKPLPAALNATDTLLVTVSFTPNSGSSVSDSLYISNNSVGSPFVMGLSGTGIANTAPYAFSIKQPAGMTVNTKNPTFTWEGRGDTDGDALSYTLQISKTVGFGTMVQFTGITDTSYVITAPLDSIGTYFWRVSANDNHGGITVSNTGSFIVDAAGPGLFVGVLGSTIQPNYIELYVHADEALASLSGIFDLRDASDALVSSDTLTIGNLSGMLYYVPYKLTVDGNLSINVMGVDAFGNMSTSTTEYDIVAVTSKAPIALHSDNSTVTVSGAKGTVDRSGYIMVTRVIADGPISESLAKAIAEQNVLPKSLRTPTTFGWTPVGERVKIISTVEIKKTLTVTMTYAQESIRGLMQQYPDFSESKIGLYREDEAQWIYEGGEGYRAQVTAKIGKTGIIGMFYNPEHVDLPRHIQLSQNYPNPFNPSTTIKFGLPDEGKVKLVIYNVLGQKVRELINASLPAGYQTAVWNGKNDLGQEVASGLYIYRLETAQGTQSMKMLLVK